MKNQISASLTLRDVRGKVKKILALESPISYHEIRSKNQWYQLDCKIIFNEVGQVSVGAVLNEQLGQVHQSVDYCQSRLSQSVLDVNGRPFS